VAAGVLLLLPFVGCGEKVEPETPVATIVRITPEAAELLASGATTGFNAVVRDQNGKAMPNASVTWTGSDPAVFTVEGNGLIARVRAVANGVGTLTATSGQASGTASITVVQTLAKLDVVSGADQVAIRGTALAEPLVVRVAEQTGGVISGVTVTFAPADWRSGSANPSEVVTDADGLASTTWTLGDARRQRMTVTADELSNAFRATAVADPPEPDYTPVGSIEASDFYPLETETVELTAQITNLGDGPSSGPFTVRFTGDGMDLGSAQVDPIQPDDTATATITAGPFAAGKRPVAVVIDPDEEYAEWNEANNSGEPDTLNVLSTPRGIALDDSVMVGGPVNSLQLFRVEVEEQVNRALTVTLNGPSGDGDLYVDFNVHRPPSGLPGRFHRRCYSWNFGTSEDCQFHPVREGTYHILVHAYTPFDNAVLKVSTEQEPEEPFDVEVVMVNEGTASQNDIIGQVAARYESMSGLGAFDGTLSLDADMCAPGMPELVAKSIDDISIYVMIGPLDGEGDAVAMSGACIPRGGANGWYGMPAVGTIVLDEADIAQLDSDGVFEAVVTREMGRAMGFNPGIWELHGFLRNPSLPESPDADTHMNAPLVVAAFNAAGGESYSGAKAPLESGAMPGISDVHWRESVFGDEVMTPYVTGDSQPLSRITLEALYEVGYELNVMMADPFTLAVARSAGPRGPKRYYGIDAATYRGRGPVATMTVRANGVVKGKDR
jgi:hypothetical protein